MPLEPDDQRHLTAAEGYLELGMPNDANEELELIDAEARHVSEVLAVRVGIYRTLKKWDLSQIVAKELALRDPDNPQWQVEWAYATRRVDCIEAARIILLNAVERQPDVGMYHYNLACYECQLGNLAEAKERLRRAIELQAAFRGLAMDDEDLKPLWDSLGELV